jgi:hypothetical protein
MAGVNVNSLGGVQHARLNDQNGDQARVTLQEGDFRNDSPLHKYVFVGGSGLNDDIILAGDLGAYPHAKNHQKGFIDAGHCLILQGVQLLRSCGGILLSLKFYTS